jgi:hypothetical protein
MFRNLFSETSVGLKPALVLEIGAYEATYSCGMAKLLPEAKIMAYESNPFVCECCRGRISEQVA